MSGRDANRCTVRYTTGRCPHRTVTGLPMCAACLEVLLSEPDPGRRRTLAAGPAAATHATALLDTGDALTALILATNPATPEPVLARLEDAGRSGSIDWGSIGVTEAEVTATITATRTGRPPPPAVISRVLDGRAVASTPITSPPAGTRQPAASMDTGPRPPTDERPDGSDTDEPAHHLGLVIGFALVVAAIVAMAVAITLSGDGGSTTETSTTMSSGAASPAGASTPEVPADPAGPGADDGDVARPLTLELTMTAREGRFCHSADIRIDYDGPDAYVIITDDEDRELWQGRWRPGTTRTVELIAPSDALHATVTTEADPDTFAPSGSVHGTFC